LNRRSCSATPASRRHPATRQRLEEREIPRVTSRGGGGGGCVFCRQKTWGPLAPNNNVGRGRCGWRATRSMLFLEIKTPRKSK
jgi:hypothetical protein